MNARSRNYSNRNHSRDEAFDVTGVKLYEKRISSK